MDLIKKVDLIDLTECNAIHIIPSYCNLPVSCRSLVDWCGSLRSCKPHIYFSSRKENDIKYWINKGRAITAMLNSVLWNRQITRKIKLLIHNSIVKSTVTYGAETWKFNKNFESKLVSMKIDFLRRSARCSRKQTI